MAERTPSLGFTEQQLPQSCHVCVIYDSDEQRRKVVGDYLAEGIARGELVRYFADGTPPEDIRTWVAAKGVEVSDAEARGGFAVASAEGAYCRAGRFDPEAMIAFNLERYAAAEKAGFPGTRASGEMAWVLKGLEGSERFLEYEALLNTVQVAFPHQGMCQYDARRFDGATLFKVLQVHPFVVAHGQIVLNPHYVKPEEFLAGVRARRASAGG